MIGIGQIVGAGASLAAGVVNSVRSNQIANEISDARQSNEDWYNKRYNESFINRADAQAALQQARDISSEQLARAKASSIVAGGTAESEAISKRAASQTVADATSSIAKQADTYKQGIENQYLSREDDLRTQEIERINQQMENTANTASQIGQSMKPL